jgi:hypothetical protein
MCFPESIQYKKWCQAYPHYSAKVISAQKQWNILLKRSKTVIEVDE